MCGVCGCGQPDETHEHDHAPAHEHGHAHGHGHHHHDHGEHEHVGPDGKKFVHSHSHAEVVHGGGEIPGLAPARVVSIQKDILGKNNELAAFNRARFARTGAFAVNLMSSPGSGKTTLLTRTLRDLAPRTKMVVVEGDQQTSLDADRIRATGAPAVQINTGKGCHLDAAMVGRALDRLPMPEGIVFIENVGNLVCPAGFDLGEHRKVVVVSVTEGEDKPLKYPDMFAGADLVLINKVDLLPHLAFDLPLLKTNLRKLKPGVKIIELSATTGEGFGPWLQWLLDGAASAKADRR